MGDLTARSGADSRRHKFIQRFGSALNLTPHYHTLVLDGVSVGPLHSPGDFAALAPPETEDVARVLAGSGRSPVANARD